MKVSELLVRSLESYGTKRAYGLVGTSILEVMDALRGSSIRYVSTRHEQVAVSMADADGRVTGSPGIALVHGGPGFLNSLVGLANSYKDSSPLVLVAGAVKRRMAGMDSWLEVPQLEMAGRVVKQAFRTEKGGDAARVFAEAYSLAASAPKGPVFVEVPEDVWSQDGGDSVRGIQPRPAPDPAEEDVERVAASIAGATKPVIVAGGGINTLGGSRALTNLLKLYEVPLVTTGNGRGAISETDPLALGRIGFGGGSVAADSTFADSDLVVCLGCGLSDVSTYGFNVTPKGEVLVVDLDPLWDRKPIPYALHSMSDATTFAERLAEKGRRVSMNQPRKEDVKRLRESWERVLSKELSVEKEGYVSPARFLADLDKTLPDDVILAAGQGLHILYAYAFLHVKTSASFLAATNMGSMGFVFPAALGAKLAFPEREVLAVMGDGEFVMTVQDLETAVREKIGAKMVVVNDNSYRVLLMRQKIQKMGRVFGTLHGNPDIVKLADAFGARGLVVDSNSMIHEGVRMLSEKTDRPTIVELKVDPEDLPPLNITGSLMF